MGYSASPRPTFSGPTAIPYQAVTRHLWGDDASGEVADWIYASTDKIHQLVFGLPPGRAFRHSEAYRTIFAADLASIIGAAVLYVLSEGSVRGFAFFLGLTTLLDLFTAFFFTRPMVLLLGRSRFFTEARWVGVARGLNAAPPPAKVAA